MATGAMARVNALAYMACHSHFESLIPSHFEKG